MMGWSRKLGAAWALVLALCAQGRVHADAVAKKPAQSPAPQGEKAAKNAAPSLLMWSLRSPTATVYVLGSVHVGSPDAFPLDPRIERAFADADTLMLEVPLDDAAMGKATTLLQRAGLYSPPDSLDKHLDAATLAKLEAALKATGLPLAPFLQMRPWFVAMSVTLLRLQSQGFKAEYGIDVHFNAAAKNKRFAAFETIEEQTALLADMPEAMQLDNLRQTLEELDDVQKVMSDAFAAWKRGDGHAIDELMLAPLRKRYPALYKRLFVDRNRRMAATIEQKLAGTGTTFVVVGAGHLVGKDSVIKMLGTRGKTIQQL